MLEGEIFFVSPFSHPLYYFQIRVRFKAARRERHRRSKNYVEEQTTKPTKKML